MHFFIRMKKQLFQEIKIPEGIEVNLDDSTLVVKGPEGENKRIFKIGKLKFEVKEGKIIIGHDKSTKTEKKMMNTITSHINNLLRGVQKKFEYKLKVCASHFPMTVKAEGNKAIIKNFLGEKIDRIVNIPNNVEIKIDKDIITITSIDKELVGQAAANFESATKIRMKDRRVFQDGIYITSKDGRVM